MKKLECTPEEKSVLDDLFASLQAAQSSWNGGLQTIARIVYKRSGVDVTKHPNLQLSPSRDAFYVQEDDNVTEPTK